MATLEVTPLILKDVELTIGTDDFKKHVSGVTFTPSTSPLTWTGLGGNTHSNQAQATWTATIDYVQDWTSAKSLSRYLYENEGHTVAATFRPTAGAGGHFSVSLVLTPGAIGGQVNAYATTSVTLGCDSKPAWVAPVQGG